MTTILLLLLPLAGVGAIVWGAEAFAEHLGPVAKHLGTSTVALAILLAGAEPEELATAVTASLRHSPAIALGDVIGANVTMCLVALGVGAVIAPLPFRGSALRYALLGLPLAAIGAYLAWDGKVSRGAGAVLILMYVVYVAAIWLIEKRPPALGEVGELEEARECAERPFRENLVNRRDLINLLAGLATASAAPASLALSLMGFSFEYTDEDLASAVGPSESDCPGPSEEFHGYVLHHLTVDGCAGYLVQPKKPLPGRRWIWRTQFWDAFPGADVAFLEAGFYVAYVEVGNTFGCPDAMKHFDVFYDTMTKQYRLHAKLALEGLSRGGLSAYRWAYVNTDKVCCVYGDAPVCDMKSWPGGKGKGSGSPADWHEAIKAYHFNSEKEMMNFKGNPIDILAPLAAAHVPIIHVCGDADTVVPESENTDIVRKRYVAMGGDFALIIKGGCGHHPHGLKDPSPVVNFISARCAAGEVGRKALLVAPKPGSVIKLTPGQW